MRTLSIKLIHLTVALLAVVAAIPGRAQQPAGALGARRPLAIEDYYRIKTIGAVTLSPDGRIVSFTVTTRIEETNGTTSESWTVPWDGSAPPSRVATDSGAGAAGGAGGGAGAAVQSPDGQWMFTVRDVSPPTRQLAAATPFEKRHADRFKGIQFDWLDYQRDGAQYPLPNVSDPYVSPPQEIFVAPSAGRNGGAERQLTSMGLRPSGVQWSKDGSHILFTGDSLYRSDKSYGRSEAWMTNVADGKLTRLTPDVRYDYRGARYSPDGKWILVTRQLTTDHVIAKKLNYGGATDLVVLPAAGGVERNLTEAWDYLPTNPQWSQDGKSIYFVGGVGGTSHLFHVSPEGGAVQAMTTGERRIGDLSMDKEMTHIAYTVATFDAPSEIWSATINGKNERQLTHVHDAFAGEVAFGHAERQQFKSADGTPIEGWLLLPAGYRARGAKLPLIVSSHGGPHSATQYGFNFKNQYFAANGYAVLEVNFRSSTGYGEKFLWGTWGAWGTKDGQDVMAGIDHVLANYALDRKRVASIGHSYGGFMTNWLITQYPDRFAAASSGAGIVNWTSDYGNADIARTKETEFFGPPWEPQAREIMIKQSPLTYVGRAKTPTLFINGEIDRRVPFTENEQLYVALKKNGVEAKMIQYADQPHGISGHWNNVHRMLNERGWFDKYMKPAQAVP